MNECWLPDEYIGLETDRLVERIRSHKRRLGDDLVILGHHYQRQEVIEHADFRGDSYGLSKTAAEQEARYIVFCGVEFMADSARILARPEQVVIHPDTSAGCPMADMADSTGVERAWADLEDVLGATDDVIPLTYINSDVGTKAFCGRHGGAVCTSTNAPRAFDWAYSRGGRVFFFPDEHLGRNTAWNKGIRGEQAVLYDPALPLGGLSPERIRAARVFLWKGHCHVHTHFTEEMVKLAREQDPEVRVVVHPECRREVVDAADADGSTSFIIDYCARAPAGSRILVGTELNLCRRLNLEHADRSIEALDRSICPNMWKVSLNDLLWSLDRLGEVNVVRVDPGFREEAGLALERMLSI